MNLPKQLLEIEPDPETKEVDPAEFDRVAREIYADGVALPRDLAVRIIDLDGWWDMFGPLDGDVIGAKLREAADHLPAGGMVKVQQADVPNEIWDRHRKKYHDPGRHGLRLKSDPDEIAVLRYADGGIGMMIGYRAV